MKKLLSFFIALAFLAGTAGISMADTSTSGAKPKTSVHKPVHHPKKSTGTKKRKRTSTPKKKSSAS